MKVVETKSLIDHLTPDKDEQQELWVHYLTFGDINALSGHLSEIRKSYAQDELLQISVWKRLVSVPPDHFPNFLVNFSELEQSVICLLALGLSLSEISEIKGITSLRLLQVITVIREHECWKQYYGLKDEIK